MVGLLGWLRAVERWGSESDRNARLLVLGLIGVFVAILAVGVALAVVYLLPPHALDLQ